MSSQRLILAFAVLATIAVVAQCEDAVFGQRQPGDEVAEIIVHSETIPEGFKFYGHDYKLKDGKNITAIELTDNNGDESDVRVTLKSGGPGESFAHIGFESESLLHIEYEIKYYAI